MSTYSQQKVAPAHLVWALIAKHNKIHKQKADSGFLHLGTPSPLHGRLSAQVLKARDRKSHQMENILYRLLSASNLDGRTSALFSTLIIQTRPLCALYTKDRRMEAAGLAVGLAGLFSAVLDALEMTDS